MAGVSGEEERLSRWTAGPVVGALGGNVLRHVRLDLDHAGGAVLLRRAPSPTRTLWIS